MTPSSPSPAPSPRFAMLRAMLALRPVPRARFAFSVRAAFSMGIPVLAGWLAGDVQSGLMAATGGFTSLYGRGRPYPSRALELGAIALAFALAVAIGSAVGAVPWALVPTVAAIAMLATWIGNALRIGPPGAYMFMLACAAAASMPAHHIEPVEAFWLVLGGGAIAWVLQMAPMLWAPRGPEQRAVAAAATAVARYLDAAGAPEAARLRQRAAQALNDAWHALVRYQRPRVRPGSALGHLRERTRRLGSLFTDAMEARALGQQPAQDAVVHARALGELSTPLPPVNGLPARDRLPLGRPGPLAILRESLRLRSMSTLVVARVGVAALVAGALGAMLGLERAYWAIAAAVLMLHQGLGWRPTLQRSLERTLGTWIGLLVAGAVLMLQPQGLWLVAAIMALQFTVEMLVMRNYALAVVFITGAGLVLASGGQPVDDLGGYLLARGVDTMVGCAVALGVFRLMRPDAAAAVIPVQLQRTFAAMARLAAPMARGDCASAEARRALRDLQHRIFALTSAYDTATAATRTPHLIVERSWPVISASEELAYRLMTACWAMEADDSGDAPGKLAAMFGVSGLDALHRALAEAQRAVSGGAPSRPVEGVPDFVAAEVARLDNALNGVPG